MTSHNEHLQGKLFGEDPVTNSINDLFTIREASQWASDFTGRVITPSNISYLVQYGLVKKYGENGNSLVSKGELETYYKTRIDRRQENWNKQVGTDLNWHLSFQDVREAETTKHVHRLHPYKGKYIPQLVAYFLDLHTDEFKKEGYFKHGDIILDPFCGSGTTLVQASELGLHAIGIDVSAFNALISNVKILDFDYSDLSREIGRVTHVLGEHFKKSKIGLFDSALENALKEFNNQFFPSPEFRYEAQHGMINGDDYGSKHADIFLETYQQLVAKFGLNLRQDNNNSFLSKWFLRPIREEIDVIYQAIEQTENTHTKNILKVILSRTIRSCRATTHSDLVTLLEPMTTTYYCPKHWKVCKPLFSIINKWLRYSKDTLNRLKEFNKLKTSTYQYCLTGDSRNINIIEVLSEENPELGSLVCANRINGIFSSPPYVGLIDYHEQHAYSYELFKFDRNDASEIGPLYRGQGQEAKESYVQGIAEVLLNCKKYLANDFNIFLVANDKYGLYPRIANLAGLQIISRFHRPVLNRSERDKSAYSETIFHLKDINNGNAP